MSRDKLADRVVASCRPMAVMGEMPGCKADLLQRRRRINRVDTSGCKPGFEGLSQLGKKRIIITHIEPSWANQDCERCASGKHGFEKD